MTEPTDDRLRVLFVDDEPQVLDALRDLLHHRRHEWAMTFADSAQKALEELQHGPVDVVVTDVRMAGLDGVELLRAIHAEYPGVARIVLSGQVDSGGAVRAAGIAHRYLSKPCSAAALAEAIECTLRHRARRQGVDAHLGALGLQQLPSPPASQAALHQVLVSPDSSPRAIAELIAQDVAMAAKVLQLVNSAFFAIPRRITSLPEAVAYLGTRSLAALALEHGIHTALTPGLSVREIVAFERHSHVVGLLARRLAPSTGADDAFAAGLLHDVGKLVLAQVEPQAHRERLRTSVRTGEGLHEIELAQLHTTHAYIGAHLLDVWGLPSEVTDAVAGHHDPQLATNPPLARAVRLADALAHEAMGLVGKTAQPVVHVDGAAEAIGALELLAGDPAELRRLRGLARRATAGTDLDLHVSVA